MIRMSFYNAQVKCFRWPSTAYVNAYTKYVNCYSGR